MYLACLEINGLMERSEDCDAFQEAFSLKLFQMPFGYKQSFQVAASHPSRLTSASCWWSAPFISIHSVISATLLAVS